MALNDNVKKLNEEEANKVNGGRIGSHEILDEKYKGRTLWYKDVGAKIGPVEIISAENYGSSLFGSDHIEVTVCPVDFQTCQNFYKDNSRYVSRRGNIYSYADITNFTNNRYGYKFIIDFGANRPTYLYDNANYD